MTGHAHQSKRGDEGTHTPAAPARYHLEFDQHDYHGTAGTIRLDEPCTNPDCADHHVNVSPDQHSAARNGYLVGKPT